MMVMSNDPGGKITFEPLAKVIPIESARVIQVIHVTPLVGMGEHGDPYRRIDQYWSLEGSLLAWHDPIREAREEMDED